MPFPIKPEKLCCSRCDVTIENWTSLPGFDSHLFVRRCHRDGSFQVIRFLQAIKFHHQTFVRFLLTFKRPTLQINDLLCSHYHVFISFFFWPKIPTVQRDIPQSHLYSHQSSWCLQNKNLARRETFLKTSSLVSSIANAILLGVTNV